jgi:ubiquinone/menaquinone biosynthesis C-methylase UbiE
MDQDIRDDKESVRDYYDHHGWRSLDDGELVDTVVFVDSRLVSQDYYARERRRERALLPSSGRFFLDAASGALPYVDYSQEWDYHVCVDFSIMGLREARRRSGLGPRGLYVNADICHLPFASGTFGAVLSAHTLYHIPERGQIEAISELLRMLTPQGSILALYFNVKSLSFRIKLAWERITGRPFTLKQAVELPPLFSQPLPKERLEAIIREVGGSPAFSCHSFMSRQMLRLVPDSLLGYWILRAVYLFETALTNLAMPLGQYFSVQIRKSH